MKYAHHPAAKIFPMMSQAELQQMAEDIKEKGLVVPIELFEGKIVDGRNREAACKLAGVEPEYTEIELDVDPISYVMTLNFHRRQLTASQKAAVAVEIEAIEARAAKERQVRKPADSVPAKMPGQKGDARDKAADKVGVSPRYISDAKKLKAEAPEVFEELKSGEITMPQAKRKLDDKKNPGKRIDPNSLRGRLIKATKDEFKTKKKLQEELGCTKSQLDNAFNHMGKGTRYKILHNNGTPGYRKYKVAKASVLIDRDELLKAIEPYIEDLTRQGKNKSQARWSPPTILAAATAIVSIIKQFK